MTEEPLPQRLSPRLQGYDYTHSGAYFVTLCTHLRQHHFGEVQNGIFTPSPLGAVAHEEIGRISSYWPAVDVDLFVVMPNRIHAIILLSGPPPAAASRGLPTLGDVVGGYKAGVTRLARRQELIDEGPLWQSRYHDHIIRSEAELLRIRTYIDQNPTLWEQDTFHS